MSKVEIANLGAGCFWCVEAIFQQLKGVEKVESGYMGGHKENPTYQEVCSGRTENAEIIRITFNPDQISFSEILDIFWHTHNPTTLNQQGNDIGTQYRSAIFYENEEQKLIAEKSKSENQKDFKDPIVTEISKASKFYKAEDYHQNYFNENPTNPYCSFVIPPKILKLKKNYADKIR